MIGYDGSEGAEDAAKYPIVKKNYLIWRLMIDQKYQRRGYGKEAMRLALEFIRTFPCGKAEYCWLSYEPDNEAARQLYRSMGFAEALEMPEGWDEIPAALKL